MWKTLQYREKNQGSNFDSNPLLQKSSIQYFGELYKFFSNQTQFFLNEHSKKLENNSPKLIQNTKRKSYQIISTISQVLELNRENKSFFFSVFFFLCVRKKSKQLLFLSQFTFIEERKNMKPFFSCPNGLFFHPFLVYVCESERKPKNCYAIFFCLFSFSLYVYMCVKMTCSHKFNSIDDSNHFFFFIL